MTPASQRTLIAGLAAALFAVLAFFSGADRYTEFQPAAVRLVAGPFRSDAALIEASRELSRGDYGAAKDHAAEAVSSSPMDARGLALLGAAQELSGEGDAARASFAAAGRLGSREPLTQAYLFASALREGDAGQAATHLDAILRARPDFAPAQGYLALLEATPEGRAALAERLRGDARWAGAYLSAGSLPVETLRQRAAFLSGAQGEVPQIGCEQILPMVRELAVRRYRGEADRLAASQCPEAVSAGPIADAEFEAVGASDEAAFSWRRHASGDVRVSRLGGDRARVELENRSSVTRLVLSQPVSLAPGRYRLEAKVDGPGGQRVAVSLDCGNPRRPSLRRDRVDREGWVVEASQCPDALLGIWLRPGSGRVVLDRVDLTPLR